MELAGARPLGTAYLLEELIGSSSTGEVWRGRARRSGTVVAVKLLRTPLVHDPDFVAGLPGERAMLTGLRDVNLAGVLDLVADGDTLGVVMEHVPGSDLRSLVDGSGPLDPSLAIVLMAQVCDGLSAIHARNEAHGALRPESILIDDSEGVPIVRLTDFGIARLTHGPSAAGAASSMGHPEYLAPEVLEQGDATPASDLYAVGAVLHELLFGQPPYGRGDAAAVLRRQREEPLVRPDGVAPGLWSVLERLLDPEPDARPGGAPSVAAELRRLAELGLEARRRVPPAGPEVLAPVPPGDRNDPAGATTEHHATADAGGPEASAPPAEATAVGRRTTAQFGGPRTELLPDRSSPAVIAAKVRPRRLPDWRWLAAGAAVLAALVVLGVALLGGGGDDADDPPLVLPEPAEVELEFDAVLAARDVAVERSWVLAGTEDEATLEGRIEVQNDSSDPVVGGRVDEYFPETLVEDLDTVSFSPDPDLVDDQGLAQWDIEELVPGGRFTVTYQVPVDPGPVTRARLEAWADDRDELRSSIAEERAAAAAVVTALTVDPRTMELPLGHDRGFSLSGLTAGGQPATDEALAGVEWTTSDPAVVTVAGTPPIISATGVGTAVVRGTLDEASVEMTVTVPFPDLSGLVTPTVPPPSGSTRTTRVTQRRPTTTARPAPTTQAPRPTTTRPPQTTTTRPPQTTTTAPPPTTTTSTPRGTLPPPP